MTYANRTRESQTSEICPGIRPRRGRGKEKGCQEKRRRERDHRRVVASWLGPIFCCSPLWAPSSLGELFSLSLPVFPGLPGCLTTLHRSCFRQGVLSIGIYTDFKPQTIDSDRSAAGVSGSAVLRAESLGQQRTRQGAEFVRTLFLQHVQHGQERPQASKQRFLGELHPVPHLPSA